MQHCGIFLILLRQSFLSHFFQSFFRRQNIRRGKPFYRFPRRMYPTLLLLIFKIFQRFGIIGYHHTDSFAVIHLRAICAGILSLAERTLPYRTHTVAKRRFYSVSTATLAIYHFNGNFYAVHFRPKLRNLFPEHVIVVECSHPRVAILAIEPAICNKFFHW